MELFTLNLAEATTTCVSCTTVIDQNGMKIFFPFGIPIDLLDVFELVLN
jgi:hypothetical protein